MGWKFCPVCGRQYNDKLGGCKNSSCKAYDASTKVVPPVQRVVVPPVKVVPPPKVEPPPKVAAPPKVKPVVASHLGAPKAVDIIVYRGEKNQWWPHPKIRLISGMTVFEPWRYRNINDLWTLLTKDMSDESQKKGDKGYKDPKRYAQYLRATGRPFALATAWKEEGSFDSDYNFTIKITNIRTFYWEADLSLGDPANFTRPSDVDAEFIVLNADTISDSTILGFGHGAGTNEITWLHDLPLDCIESCTIRETEGGKVTTTVKSLSDLKSMILRKDQLSLDERMKWQKLFRP